MPTTACQTEKVRKVGSGLWDRSKKKEKPDLVEEERIDMKALMVLREHLYKLQLDIYKNSLKDV